MKGEIVVSRGCGRGRERVGEEYFVALPSVRAHSQSFR